MGIMYKSFFIIILFFVSCSSKYYNYNYNYQSFYVGNNYIYSDCGVRHLTIKFINDSIFELINAVSNEQAPNAARFGIKQKYVYNADNISYIVVKRLLETNKLLSKNEYRKPYRGTFYEVSNIFPNIENDTIRFSGDFKKLQILEFSFDKTDKQGNR